jgi:hypothetical protein
MSKLRHIADANSIQRIIGAQALAAGSIDIPSGQHVSQESTSGSMILLTIVEIQAMEQWR